MNLRDTAIIVTAYQRPAYLRQVLASWQAARGISGVHSFTLALGWADGGVRAAQVALHDAFRKETGLGPRGRIKMDSPQARASRGMHRAIAEAADRVLEDPEVRFVVFGEEDQVVSADVLEYMEWARDRFAGQEKVLAACAHSRGGQGWDPKVPPGDGDADQEAVRLVPYFCPWVWGTWRDRWDGVLRPEWDWECSKGPRPDQMGYDWGIFRMTQRDGRVCVVPDASRSQNIGRDGGWAADPAEFHLTQALSFRADRGPVPYRLEGAAGMAA